MKVTNRLISSVESEYYRLREDMSSDILFNHFCVYMTIEKTIWAFVNKMMSLLFNMLSRFFMDFKSGAMVRNLPVSADERDVGWIPGMGRSPGG